MINGTPSPRISFEDEPAVLAELHGREKRTEREGMELDLLLPEREGARCPLCEAMAATVYREVDGRLTFACVNCYHGLYPDQRLPWTPAPSALQFLSMRELSAKVAAAGPARYFLRGLWAAGDYGVLSADAKGQKTWTTVDAFVSQASGAPFLGIVAVDDPGPVLVFFGEGGDANMLRRVRATAEARGVVADDLPIVFCSRAPHLTDARHLALLEEQIKSLRPRGVYIDPLYLAAPGAKLGDLYAMGELLERPQHLCADVGAALWVTTHNNRKEGKGASRILGAGPAEWGRVLATAEVKARHRDAETGGTDVLTEIDFLGGGIAGATLRVRRQIWADDPDDLNSPLHLKVTAEAVDDSTPAAAADGLSPAARKLLEALDEGPAEVSILIDRVAARHGHGLKRETVSRNLAELERRGKAEATDQGSFRPKVWSLKGGADAV